MHGDSSAQAPYAGSLGPLPGLVSVMGSADGPQGALYLYYARALLAGWRVSVAALLLRRSGF